MNETVWLQQGSAMQYRVAIKITVDPLTDNKYNDT